MSAAAPSQPRWLFGPATDLLFGCGVGYALLLLAVAALPASRGDLLVWGALATLFTGMPHYGATLLRVYGRRADRRRYALFAVWLTLLVWGVFMWGVYDVFVGSVLLTVYLTWSPWHYSGQNYGLAVMFLRRGGVPLEAPVKRWLYASFLLSYALAFVSLHGVAEATGYGPILVGHTYSFLPLGIPHGVFDVLAPALLVAELVALGIVALALLRRAPLADLAPAAALVATQGVWFTLPAAALWWSGSLLSSRHVVFLFVWVAVGHSIQYLWVTTYYAAGREPPAERVRYLAKTMFAGAAIWTVPALVFSPALLGTTTYQLGLFMLVASAVNLHHFILDGAIWKLRDGPVARVLLARPDPGATQHEPDPPRWLVRGLWAGGLACTAIAVAGPWLHSMVWSPAVLQRDWDRAARVETLLRWIGREEPGFLTREGDARLERNDLDGALDAYERSLRLAPTANAWIGVSNVQARHGDVSRALESLHRSLNVEEKAGAWTAIGMLREYRRDLAGAVGAYERAIALDPRDLRALVGAGRTAHAQGDSERAQRLLGRAAALAPDDPDVRAALQALDS